MTERKSIQSRLIYWYLVANLAIQTVLSEVNYTLITLLRVPTLGCANKDLWALCAPIFIIVTYCRTATTYFLGGKE